MLHLQKFYIYIRVLRMFRLCILDVVGGVV